MVIMSRNITNVLMTVDVEEPKITIKSALNNADNRVINNENLSTEDSFWVGNVHANTNDLNEEERNSINQSINLYDVDKEINDPTIHQIISYHVSLLSSRYGKEAVEDFLHNNIYQITK